MKVSVVKDEKLNYNVVFPFNPSIDYPEYPFKGNLSEHNLIYDKVRELFKALALDEKNFGAENWNPLGEIISPGDNVLLKPNWVCHLYRKTMKMDTMISSSILTRAVLDYVCIALKGKGSVTIGDAPIDVAQFDEILNVLNIDKIVDFYKTQKIEVKLVDFRNEIAIKKNGMIVKRIKLKGDPLGYTVVDLGRDSELMEIIGYNSKFRSLEYDPNLIVTHHNDTVNEYLIPNTVLTADVIINLPKLKTHKKAGITAALKNMIGIMAAKEWLPHHRRGSKDEGCDEYLCVDWRKRQMGIFTDIIDGSKNIFIRRFFQILRKLFSLSGKFLPFNCPYFEGSWRGNETISKTITDLNKIIFYASKDGKMSDKKQRKMFVLVDGIVAGEGEGPLRPSSKQCGLLIAGSNPASVDLVCSKIMGFDYLKIPTLTQVLKIRKYKLMDFSEGKIIMLDKNAQINFEDIPKAYNFHFKPASGWQGFIEAKE